VKEGHFMKEVLQRATEGRGVLGAVDGVHFEAGEAETIGVLGECASLASGSFNLLSAT